MTALPPALARLVVALGWHRRWLAAGLAAAAVAVGIGAARPAPAETTTVLVSARDLAGGTALTAADLRTVTMPVAVVPAGVLRPGQEPLGRLLVGPVRAGEALTDVRVLGPGLLAALPGNGLVAATVRLDDEGAAALLRTGDKVDVLAASSQDSPGEGRTPRSTATVVATDVTVLAVPRDAEGSTDGGLVVIATDPPTASRLAAAAVTDRLSAVVRRSTS